MRTHPSTVVTLGGWSAEVDVELAPLVLEVWRSGIETIHSCQDVGENIAGLVAELPHLEPVAEREEGRASIGFADVAGLLAFHDALANAGPRDAFYERILHWATPDAWQCVIGLQERGLSRLAAASFQVRFPRSDIEEATERLRLHNRADTMVAEPHPDHN